MTQSARNKLLILSVILIALSAALLFIPGRVKTPAPGLDSQKDIHDSKLYVSRVIDGDTFELSNGRTVRLIGVDTPETDMPYYNEAVTFAESLLSEKQITIELDKERMDKYGRLLIYAYTDSIFVNEMIIGRGLGIVYLFESNLKRAGTLIESQSKARAAALGIWSLPAPSPEDYYINIAGSYRFHRPLCIAIKRSDPEKRKTYHSRGKLLDKGFSPCRNCRP
ncbi:MAG: thermonuclease family protein [Candidatus Zixiibacteriota bacterium]|nr:MAG: thermonuclease family protein [candidate division Zixibacteria bacterium]